MRYSEYIPEVQMGRISVVNK